MDMKRELNPLTEFASERGLTRKQAETMLRAIPGAIRQAKPKAKIFVNLAALQIVKTIAERVGELETEVHDHRLRIEDIEAKSA